MLTKENARNRCATGNAAAPQKLELDGFSGETQVWAWNAFKAQARFIAVKNHFTADEQSALEAEALSALLSDAAIGCNPACERTAGDYLRGVIARKLRCAAAKIADDRSVWTDSRRSLDAPAGDEPDSGTLGDLVANDATLGDNSVFLTPPRAVRIRNRIRRLRNAKDAEALARYREGLSVREEVAYPDGDANGGETIPGVFKMRPAGFGGRAAGVSREGLKADVRGILRTLPADLQDWCRAVMRGDDPSEAYRRLRIEKNDYYRKVLPRLRKAFAELADEVK